MQPIRKLGYRREWVVSTTPHYVYPPGHRPSTHCTSGWIGFRAGLDENVKFQPPQGFDSRNVQSILRPYTDFVKPVAIPKITYVNYELIC